MAGMVPSGNVRTTKRPAAFTEATLPETERPGVRIMLRLVATGLKEIGGPGGAPELVRSFLCPAHAVKRVKHSNHTINLISSKWALKLFQSTYDLPTPPLTRSSFA